ncbi:MAG: Fis family transcriptional regulator [Saccharospirillaceae bacterium]|nr:hypothetical protein [Pseudomonadales bacterium]NRB78662.1 Fis family transcriptional regulator [Saccharospirillaceae bacterium]
MRKTDKKIDNQLIKVLTGVCDMALKEIKGFEWLTHLVNYSNFPKSLKIVCVFDNNENLKLFKSNANNQQKLQKLIQSKLLEVDVKVKNIVAHLGYDTQENCEKEHDGNWAKRLV